MKRLITTAVVLGICLASSVVFAQDSKVQTINFEDDRIEGDLMVPNSEMINAPEKAELSNLVKAREDYVDETRKTVDEI